MELGSSVVAWSIAGLAVAIAARNRPADVTGSGEGLRLVAAVALLVVLHDVAAASGSSPWVEAVVVVGLLWAGWSAVRLALLVEGRVGLSVPALLAVTAALVVSAGATLQVVTAGVPSLGRVDAGLVMVGLASGAAAAMLAVTARTLWTAGAHGPVMQRKKLRVLGLALYALAGCAAIAVWDLARDPTGADDLNLLRAAMALLVAVSLAPPRWLARWQADLVRAMPPHRTSVAERADSPTDVAAHLVADALALTDGFAARVTGSHGAVLASHAWPPSREDTAATGTTVFERRLLPGDGRAHLEVVTRALVPLLSGSEIDALDALCDEVGLAFERAAVADRARERERNMAEAERIAGTGRFTYTPATGAFEWSEGMYRLFGLDPETESLTLRTARAALAEEDVERLDELVLDGLAAGDGWEVSHGIVLPDGTTRTVESRVTITRDAAGHAARVTGVYRDVTDERERLARLERQQRQLRRLGRELVASKERERRRIGLHLHDEIGQAVTALQLQVAAHEASCDGAELGALRDQLRELHQRVRQLADELRPAVLDDLGLAAGIRHLGAQAGELLKLQVRTELGELTGRLDPALETAAYRIVQEALTNVARHAGVGSASVSIAASDGALEVCVHDDGVGFEPQEGELRGIGLSGMHERAAALGGTVTVTSEPGGGTQVCATLPVQEPRSGAEPISIPEPAMR